MRRKAFSALLTVIGAGTIVLGAQTAAQAEWRDKDAGYAEVGQDTQTGYCEALVESEYDARYAFGTFINKNAGWSCTGWLERSTDGGHTWYRISGYHTVADGNSVTNTAYTGQYWDTDGYYARACFHLNFSGAANHCTDAYY